MIAQAKRGDHGASPNGRDAARAYRPPTVDPRHRVVAEPEIIETLLVAGWLFEVEAGGRETAEIEARAVLESLIAQGLGYRHDPVAGPLFDPVEVLNLMTWAGLMGHDRSWEDRIVRTSRALVENLKCSLNAAKSDRVTATLKRSFDLRGFAEGQRLRLRCPIALAGTDDEDLIVTPMISPDISTDAVLRGDHLEVRCVRAGVDALTIGAQFEFTPKTETPDEGELSPAARDLYLRAVEWPIKVTPRVAGLAAALAGGADSPRDVVAAFWDYMMDALIFGVVRYSDLEGQAPTDWVLDNGWFDCHFGSALLISLCRARGVPARLVSGYFLYPLAPSNHFWAEIWFEGEGWRSFDLWSWSLSVGGRDRAWRTLFAGHLEPRLVTQRFPLAFTGPMSARFPVAWWMSQTRREGALALSYREVPDGRLIYRDTVSVAITGTGPMRPAI